MPKIKNTEFYINPHRNRFNLYIRPDASPELRAAHSRYVAAVEASWVARDPHVQEAWDAVEKANLAYGAVLLREDKARNPSRYAA